MESGYWGKSNRIKIDLVEYTVCAGVHVRTTSWASVFLNAFTLMIGKSPRLEESLTEGAQGMFWILDPTMSKTFSGKDPPRNIVNFIEVIESIGKTCAKPIIGTPVLSLSLMQMLLATSWIDTLIFANPIPKCRLSHLFSMICKLFVKFNANLIKMSL